MKRFSVLVEGEAWISVSANSDSEAEENAKRVLESNPWGWDSVHATVMNEEEDD